MPTRRWVVRRSGIHGRGVFATTDLARGEHLMHYRGEKIAWAEANRRYRRSGQPGHTFFFDLGDGQVLDAGREGNSARWINHGCSPNVEATQVGDRVTLHVVRRIRAGQELLLDYRLVLDDRTDGASYTCHCRSSSCRGTMLAG